MYNIMLILCAMMCITDDSNLHRTSSQVSQTSSGYASSVGGSTLRSLARTGSLQCEISFHVIAKWPLLVCLMFSLFVKFAAVSAIRCGNICISLNE